MDKIRQKAQSLLEKLHDKYGLQSKQHIHLVIGTMGKQEAGISDSLDHWYLVDMHGQKFRLPKTMLFLGREECDVVVASQSVDKRHAVLAYDIYLNRFKVKDLSTTNGTFVNNCRIPDQEYISLNHMDSIRLGQEAMMYHMEQASQITEHGGQLPDPHFIPPWASKARDSPTIHLLSHPLAECQLHYIGLYGWFPTLGCIAEQNIEHTCHCRHERFHDASLHLEEMQRLHYPHHSSPHNVKDLMREHHQPQKIVPFMSRDMAGVAQHIQVDQSIDQQKADEGHILINDSTRDKQSNPSSSDENSFHESKQSKHEIGQDVQTDPTTVTSDSPEGEDPATKSAQSVFFVSLSNNKDSANSKSNSPHTTDHCVSPHGSKYRESPRDGSAPSTSSSSPGLISERVEAVTSPTPVTGGTMESQNIKVPKGLTYMEIPLKDDDDCMDSKDYKSGMSAGSQNVVSGQVRGSILGSPQQKQQDQVSRTQSPGSEMNPATSFTIDLTDPERPPTKSLNICSSISEFVPSKMRRSFQGRKNVASKISKTSEEYELATHIQSKVDSTVVSSQNKPTRLTGVSLRPPNLGEISRLSDSSEQRGAKEKKTDKNDLMKKSKSGKSPLSSRVHQTPQSPKVHQTPQSPKVHQTPQFPPKVHQTPQSPKGNQTPPSLKVASFSFTKSVPVNVSDYQHPTNYLIDKMLEGGISLPAWSGQKHIKDQHPKGVIDQDKPIFIPTEKTLIRPVVDSTGYHSSATKINTAYQVTSLAEDSSEYYDNNDEEELQIVEKVPSEKDDKEDKVSEAGTYTIETDTNDGQEEEEEARRRIGLVFGVENIDVEYSQDLSDLKCRFPVNGDANGSEHDNMCDDNENTLMDDLIQSPEDDTDNIIDDFDDEAEPTNMALTNSASTWVSQLTSLTNQKSTSSNRIVHEEVSSSLSTKPPQGGSRKRPGTGRKLPSIPCDSGSPGRLNDLQGRSPNVMSEDAGQVFTYDGSGGNILVNSRKSESVTGQTIFKSTTKWDPTSANRSPGIQISGDIQPPHHDPITTSYRVSQSKKSPQDSRDNTAHINGNDYHVTPGLYKSSRDALAKRQQNVKSLKPDTATTILTASLEKNLSSKIISPTNPKALTFPRSVPSVGGAKKLSASDIFSRKDSLDNASTTSDVSSEAGDGSLSRFSTKAKASITMTRTNKTFDLRRARAGSFDEPRTFRAQKDQQLSVRSVKPLSSLKSSAVTLANNSPNNNKNLKSRGVDDASHNKAGSAVSQVIKKYQGNSTQVPLQKSGSTVLSQTESGIHSLNQKLYRASSLTITHPVPGCKQAPSPRSQLKTTTAIRNSLTIRNINSITGKSQSQPGSRSSSPKAAEKMAWKRRKEYDARKSVAEAKVNKIKDINNFSVNMKLKLADNFINDKKMIRSASFTNSVFVQNSVSNSHDFTDRRDSNYQHFDPRRSFQPFQNSSHNGMSSHSTDEDDSIASAASTTPSYDSLVAASVHQLSQKLTKSTDVMLSKLKEHSQTCHSPSTDDDFANDSGKSEMTAWKTVNQELAGTLKNLRMLERHVQIINAALFPDHDSSSEVLHDTSAVSQQGKHKLLENIERNLGFQPIDQPHLDENDTASPEMAEISEQFR